MRKSSRKQDIYRRMYLQAAKKARKKKEQDALTPYDMDVYKYGQIAGSAVLLITLVGLGGLAVSQYFKVILGV